MRTLLAYAHGHLTRHYSRTTTTCQDRRKPRWNQDPRNSSIRPALSHVLSLPKGCRSVRDAIRLKHYSIRTEQAYIGWIKRYIFFHDVRHPAEMGAAEVEAFLTHLAVFGKPSW